MYFSLLLKIQVSLGSKEIGDFVIKKVHLSFRQIETQVARWLAEVPGKHQRQNSTKNRPWENQTLKSVAEISGSRNFV